MAQCGMTLEEHCSLSLCKTTNSLAARRTISAHNDTSLPTSMILKAATLELAAS